MNYLTLVPGVSSRNLMIVFGVALAPSQCPSEP